ncbi:hypothetical protein Patl1_35838 [Pistacia atlantica]|nr:hypothetical protein Patl1_35838 [Pistacia atlantica]
MKEVPELISVEEPSLQEPSSTGTNNDGLNDHSDGSSGVEYNPQDAWLPITESRNGSIYSAVFHLLCSGIGFPALLLPGALASLGWTWGIICLSLAFSWQLYTIWLLVQLAESVPGTRFSRYLYLAISAFGPKLGKLLAIFPVMYLSGGSCTMLVITGGGNIELFFRTIFNCGAAGDEAKTWTGAAWFMLFACLAIAVARLPNLNSLAKVSMIGATTAVGYCSLIWVLSISEGRPRPRPNGESEEVRESDMAKFGNILNAIGTIVLAFRGHNLVLEIQGTLPSSRKEPSCKLMWKGVIISNLITAMCLFPLAIAGFWAYGNKVPAHGGMLSAFLQIHGHNTPKYLVGTIYQLVVINSLSSFPIYAMPVLDNLEFKYTIKKKKQCPGWVRTGLRVFFGGVVFLGSSGISIPGKLGSSNWRNCIAFDLCLSMFHQRGICMTKA